MQGQRTTDDGPWCPSALMRSATLEAKIRNFFGDQFELFAPILALAGLVLAGVAIYGAATGHGALFAGPGIVSAVCFLQAAMGWARRRRRGDDKWVPQ